MPTNTFASGRTTTTTTHRILLFVVITVLHYVWIIINWSKNIIYEDEYLQITSLRDFMKVNWSGR